MQYEEYSAICSQGTQTKLSTVNKDDVLVSFTSTYSLLSTTFTQFLMEVSQMLQLPLDKDSPLLPVERLLSEFKERSLELHTDSNQLSFHSPLILTPPDNILTPNSSTSERPSSSTSSPRHTPVAGTPPQTRVTSPLKPVFPPQATLVTSEPSVTLMSTSIPQSSKPVSSTATDAPYKLATLPRIPVIHVPAKTITPELPDSTHRITPPLSNMKISEAHCIPGASTSERSAFFKPAPKLEAMSVAEPDSSTHIKSEPNSPDESKSDRELLDCLQKLQNCYDKYITPQTLPFSLNSLLQDTKPIFPTPNTKPTFPHTSTFPGLSLPPSFLNNLTDPTMIIKAMQQNNPLLKPFSKQTTHPPFRRPEFSVYSSPMQCPYCELTFHKKSHLSNHLVQLHSCSYHCCRQCKISFPDRPSLEIHQQSHPKQQFQCSGCNLSFKTGSELKRHIKTHTQERAFMCDICGSRFNLKHNLKAHMRQHTGERPFRCKICNRGFTRSNNLKRHLYAHCQEGATRSSPELITMVPNMVLVDSSRLVSHPMGSEVKVD